ncbi:methylated-DNA--[protein]-cysteine S-methyltransferase [Janibacter limosus]|jgi:methylated-DNA-[protein]-cysteine S-methyltransferase|uniref:Methylated-DNA--protein-cysteine methyltransferase n=1 Tax=Janibacter limosus TaxID=53458 RepID=A0A4P6MVL5_9MICO|nr:methylated-DNA--[protein]-cysteine S-methyltransferase [Janibacter limosus]QBF46986.1 methylated-DNA--[protein]-cysteine S-methyltransferase [Janibacter limosus]
MTTETADLTRLRAGLAARADDAGLLDIAYRVVDSPLGALLLAATEQGVLRVAFASEGHDAVLTDLADRVSPRVLAAPRRLDEAARELDEYFAGRLREITVPIDLRLLTGYRREVVTALPRVAYGHTASYAQLAALTGRPRAVRAVGSACAHNPVPLLLPCHRIVRSDGGAGDYLGGPDAKRALLRLEGAGAGRTVGP